MRSQTKPFTVEVKTRRKPLTQPAAALWGEMEVLDAPAPDDLPTRNVREDAPAEGSPLEVAQRVFGALTTDAITVPGGLGDPPEAPAQLASSSPDTNDGNRVGRILPSLVPMNPFDADVTNEEEQPRKRRYVRRATTMRDQAAPAIRQEISESEMLPSPERAEAPANVRAPPRKRSRRRKDRVPAGERWKRRRLPKALW
jgi:hypothetical protein